MHVLAGNRPLNVFGLPLTVGLVNPNNLCSAGCIDSNPLASYQVRPFALQGVHTLLSYALHAGQCLTSSTTWYPCASCCAQAAARHGRVLLLGFTQVHFGWNSALLTD